MKLRFSKHLTAKTRRDCMLKVYPDGEPRAFLTQCEEERRGEGVASTRTFDFPDYAVVIARTEFGSAVISPDEPGDVAIEVHIGPEANDVVAAAAEVEARGMAAKAGIEEGEQGIPGFSGFSIIRH